MRAGGRRLAGLSLHPERPRPGPPLVFLHEGLGCIGFWKDVPDRLCGRLGLPGLVYDRWGYGGSEAFDRPRHAAYLDDEAHVLAEVLTVCGLERPVLIGHSDGASIALLFAAHFPERPAAVIAEAGHVFVEDVTLEGIRGVVELYRSGNLRRTLERFHGPQADAVFSAWADCWLAPEFRGWNIESFLPRVTAPVLVMQGEADEYATRAQVEAIARGVGGPVETLVVPQCAHVPHHQTTDLFIEACERFIQRWTAARPLPIAV